MDSSWCFRETISINRRRRPLGERLFLFVQRHVNLFVRSSSSATSPSLSLCMLLCSFFTRATLTSAAVVTAEEEERVTNERKEQRPPQSAVCVLLEHNAFKRIAMNLPLSLLLSPFSSCPGCFYFSCCSTACLLLLCSCG